MTISAVYIVRNSEQTIRQSINCALKYCDEIIIVDTGSNDNTINEVMSCKSAKVRIENFEWCSDFSKARNYAMQFATMEYILILDSDEMINQLEVEEMGDWFMADILNKKYEEFLKKDLFLTHESPRLFKRELKPYYEGLIHENVSTWRADKKRGKALIEIIHTGYEDAETLKKKIDRNFAIAEKQLIEQPNNLNNAVNMFKIYFGYKEYDKAINYGVMALLQPLNIQTKTEICNGLYRLYFNMDNMYFAFFYLSLSIDLMPNQIIGNVYLIEYFLYSKQFEKIDIVIKYIQNLINQRSSGLPCDYYYSDEDFEYFKNKVNKIKSYGN